VALEREIDGVLTRRSLLRQVAPKGRPQLSKSLICDPVRDAAWGEQAGDLSGVGRVFDPGRVWGWSL